MKVLAAVAALLLVVWFVLKVALLALGGLFHLLAMALPFLFGATAACVLAAVAFRLSAWWIKRRKPVPHDPAGPGTGGPPGGAGLTRLAGPSTNPSVRRPAAAPPPSLDLQVPPPKPSGTKTASGPAGGDMRASAPFPGQRVRVRGPAVRSTRSPASAPGPAGRGSHLAVTSPGSVTPKPTQPGRAVQPRLRSRPNQVIVIEHCQGGQVGRDNDQLNVHCVSLPDVTLTSERDLAERIFGPGAPWSQDVFSHDARPDLVRSGHIGFGASSSSVLCGPGGNTLVIVRNSRGIAVGDHGSQRNEFSVRVRAVNITADGFKMTLSRGQAIEQLRAHPGDRRAAESLADDIAGAAATELEVEMTAVAAREVNHSQMAGRSAHVRGLDGFQLGEGNRQRVTLDVTVSRPRTGQLVRLILDAAGHVAEAARRLEATRPPTDEVRLSSWTLGPGQSPHPEPTSPRALGHAPRPDIRGPAGPAVSPFSL